MHGRYLCHAPHIKNMIRHVCGIHEHPFVVIRTFVLKPQVNLRAPVSCTTTHLVNSPLKAGCFLRGKKNCVAPNVHIPKIIIRGEAAEGKIRLRPILISGGFSYNPRIPSKEFFFACVKCPKKVQTCEKLHLHGFYRISATTSAPQAPKKFWPFFLAFGHPDPDCFLRGKKNCRAP